MGSANQYLCGAKAVTSDAGSLAVVGSWTISVSGAVAHPYNATIEEMVDEESQTVVLGCSCAGNPADGIASVNAQVIGVPVTELLRHADPVEGANTIVLTSADGYEVALPSTTSCSTTAPSCSTSTAPPLPSLWAALTSCGWAPPRLATLPATL